MKNALSNIAFYRGYYGRDITAFDILSVETKYEGTTLGEVDSILTKEVIALPLKIGSINSDLEGLVMIMKSAGKIKSFDFDGQRFTWDDVGSIIDKTKKELKEHEAALAVADEKIFALSLSRTKRNGSEDQFKQDYQKLFSMTMQSHKDLKLYQDTTRILSPIFESQVSMEVAYAIMNQTRLREAELKLRLEALMTNEAFVAALAIEKKVAIDKYIAFEKPHFDGTNFNQYSMQLLFEALEILRSTAIERTFSFKKDLLQVQVSLLS
jgi:hypothetical protein